MKNWIQRLLGVDIIQEQNRIMILNQKEIIRLKKLHINENTLVHSDKKGA